MVPQRKEGDELTARGLDRQWGFSDRQRFDFDSRGSFSSPELFVKHAGMLARQVVPRLCSPRPSCSIWALEASVSVRPISTRSLCSRRDESSMFLASSRHSCAGGGCAC